MLLLAVHNVQCFPAPVDCLIGAQVIGDVAREWRGAGMVGCVQQRKTIGKVGDASAA